MNKYNEIFSRKDPKFLWWLFSLVIYSFVVIVITSHVVIVVKNDLKKDIVIVITTIHAVIIVKNDLQKTLW